MKYLEALQRICSLSFLSHRHLSQSSAALIVALYVATIDNVFLWKAILKIVPPLEGDNLRIVVTFFVLVLGFFTILFSLFGIKRIFKPSMVLILIIAAVVSYFMNSFGVMIDRSMIQNVLETDIKEATELMSWGLAWHVTLFGLFPAIVLCAIPIKYGTLGKELRRRVLFIGLVLLIVGSTVFASYKDFSLIVRQNRHLRMMVNPSYPVYAVFSYFRKNVLGSRSKELQLITQSVIQEPSWQERDKPRLVVFVLGETARAANFSLNGYARDTNPVLSSHDILYFDDTSSCATSTAESIPCIFSPMQRKNYNNRKAKSSENLLDLLTRSGVNVLWRENNSGAKGVDKRVASENMNKLKVDGLCNEDECRDEILLHNLQDVVDRNEGDMFVVLHQKGSHGPHYFKRVPDSFRRFTPECRLEEVQKCSQEQIVNSYDNTILYTDYFLGKTIDFLKSNSADRDTALIYMSDHGESLGENGIYLHGAPYFMAPEGQTHIPFLVWLSTDFTRNAGVDWAGLSARTSEEFSHDNLFDSVLGLFDIKTDAYRPELDVFAPVRKQ